MMRRLLIRIWILGDVSENHNGEIPLNSWKIVFGNVERKLNLWRWRHTGKLWWLKV